ncbi:MAG: flippase [Deltaproteobacteria bacterium]|nr:flippase [Deltaproteobacteria bacterium]
MEPQANNGPRPGRIAEGIGHQFIERAVVSVVSVLMSALVARHLGPDNLGALSWGGAMLSLFAIAANMGMDLVAVRLISERPEDEGRVMGTALTLKVVGALVMALAFWATIRLVQPPSNEAALAAWVYGFQLIANPLATANIWFQARFRTGDAARVRLASFAVITLTRLAVIFLDGSVVALAWVAVAETALAGLLVSARWWWAAARSRTTGFDGGRARELLRFGWPELVSGIAVTIYLKIDQVMLGNMASQSELGQYAAATRLVESTYVLPVIVTGVVSPLLFRLHATDLEAYRRTAQKLHDAMFTLGLVIALSMSALSVPICWLLFGAVYPDAPGLLALQSWSVVFVALNVSTGKLTHAEGLLSQTIYRQILGAFLNVGLNLLWIPRWGAHGAAVATLVSYAFSCYVAFLFSARVRHLAGYVSRAVLSPPRVIPEAVQWLIAAYRERGRR